MAIRALTDAAFERSSTGTPEPPEPHAGMQTKKLRTLRGQDLDV